MLVNMFLMRIIEKNKSIDEVVDVVLRTSRYQKVVLCLDETSDMRFIEDFCKKIDKNVILIKYYYNARNNDSFFNMVNNGARVVLYNVSIEHFYKLRIENNFLLNIFVPQTEFVLPYMESVESVYGDNLLICDTSLRDNASILILYDSAFDNIWGALVRAEDVDTDMFKKIDSLANCKQGFCEKLLEIVKLNAGNVQLQYLDCDEKELPFYVYSKLSAVFRMLEKVYYGNEEYVDFYKTIKSQDEIERAYRVLVKHNIVELVRNNIVNLVKINVAVLNRIKIIIKKYFNFKNIKINKLNKILKNKAKVLNIDNLLYISYILNAI